MQDHAGTVIGGITEVSRPYGRTLHEARERRELVAPALEHERRLGAVEPDEHHLPRHGGRVAASRRATAGTATIVP